MTTEPGDEPRQPRLGSIAIAAVAAGLLFTPALAFVAGSRGQPNQNRPPVAFPSRADGWNAAADLVRAVNDRLPLRGSAIRVDGWIDEHIFNEDRAFGGSARPAVLTGIDNTLFLNDEITIACATAVAPEGTAAQLRDFAAVIAASGRDIVTLVAPNKSTVHPELLPSDFPGRTCARDYGQALWSELASAGITGYTDLRAALERLVVEKGRPVYLRDDTHWDNSAALAAAEVIIEELAPGLWSDAHVVDLGPVDYVGDLTVLEGDPRSDTTHAYGIRRADVTAADVETTLYPTSGSSVTRYRNDAPTGSLIQGRTVAFIDSFGVITLPMLTPYFADLTWVLLDAFEPEDVMSLLADADHVVFMTVERELARRVAAMFGNPAFLDQLAAALAN